MKLHDKILNLPYARSPTWPHRRDDYDQGHLDARKAAAELAAAYAADVEKLRAALRLVRAWFSPDTMIGKSMIRAVDDALGEA